MQCKLASSVLCSSFLVAMPLAGANGPGTPVPEPWGVTVLKATTTDAIPDVVSSEGARFLLVWVELRRPKQKGVAFPLGSVAVKEDAGPTQAALGLDCEVPVEETPFLLHFSDMKHHGRVPDYDTSMRGEWYPTYDEKGRPKPDTVFCSANGRDMILLVSQGEAGAGRLLLPSDGPRTFKLVFAFPVRSEAKAFDLVLEGQPNVPILPSPTP